MSWQHRWEIELNPVFAEEMRGVHGDLEEAIREALAWVISRVLLATDAEGLRLAFDGLDPRTAILRAVVACELLARASARPDQRRWLCEYLGGCKLSDGGRYQLANAWCRLGVEARRGGDIEGAVDGAQRGLDVVADLPSQAITANLYYNLAIAQEIRGDVEAAAAAFRDSAEIDELIGRPGPAEDARRRADGVRHSP
jgi:hypothetical protein